MIALIWRTAIKHIEVMFWKWFKKCSRNDAVGSTLALHPFAHQGLIELTCINFYLEWINDYIHYKVWDEIINPFPTDSFFNGAAVEVWEWLSNFIQHYIGQVIVYLC